MIYEIVASHANLIWHYIEKNGQIEQTELLKNLKLGEAEFNMALGWLLREAKISFFYLEKKAIIAPAY